MRRNKECVTHCQFKKNKFNSILYIFYSILLSCQLWRAIGSSSLLNKAPLGLLSSGAQSRSFHPCCDRACTAKSYAAHALRPSKSPFNTRTWQTNGEGWGGRKEGGRTRQKEADYPPTVTEPLAGNLNNPLNIKQGCRQSYEDHNCIALCGEMSY